VRLLRQRCRRIRSALQSNRHDRLLGRRASASLDSVWSRRWKAGFRGPGVRRRRKFESAAGRSPPLFIAVAADDQTVGLPGSIDLFGAWRKAGLPAELHVFQTGQHGFGKKAAVRITTWTGWRNG